MKNEYKISLLRNFGTEQLSITGTVSDVEKISEVGSEMLAQAYSLVDEAFKKTVIRHDEENLYIADRFKAKREEIRQTLIKEGKSEAEIKKTMEALEKGENIKK